MLDPQDEQFDRRLATHLVSLYHQSREAEEGTLLDMTVLRDFIAYARNYIHPNLSEEAGQALIHAYVGESGHTPFQYNHTLPYYTCSYFAREQLMSVCCNGSLVLRPRPLRYCTLSFHSL